MILHEFITLKRDTVPSLWLLRLSRYPNELGCSDLLVFYKETISLKKLRSYYQNLKGIKTLFPNMDIFHMNPNMQTVDFNLL